MTAELRSVLVCSPRAAGWDRADRFTAWREAGFLHPPDFSAAQSQHNRLCEQLELAGVQSIQLPYSSESTLDAVYTHDASLNTEFGLILMNPGKSSRRGEPRHHRALCENLGIPILGEVVSPGTAEAGDIVWLDSRTLLVGNGYRTNAEGIAQLRKLLAGQGVEVIAASLPYGAGPSACLHLMSLISLLDGKTAVVDLPWLSVATVELLKARGFCLIEIHNSERESLACNVLALGLKRLLAFEENAQTNQKLIEAGFEVRTFAGSELGVNGGGGPTCLTRPLLRVDAT
jgi:N-dimethylarginine dimethylaminohydrolase